LRAISRRFSGPSRRSRGGWVFVGVIVFLGCRFYAAAFVPTSLMTWKVGIRAMSSTYPRQLQVAGGANQHALAVVDAVAGVMGRLEPVRFRLADEDVDGGGQGDRWSFSASTTLSASSRRS
jgi:hypothetical protein